MEWPKEFIEIVDDPLLADVKVPTPRITADDRTQQKINELKKWIEENGHEPSKESKEIKEKLLAVSIETLKKNGLWM